MHSCCGSSVKWAGITWVSCLLYGTQPLLVSGVATHLFVCLLSHTHRHTTHDKFAILHQCSMSAVNTL